MKADLFVQGKYWATIDVPGDSLLALLAKGMITQAHERADHLMRDLNSIEGVNCTISLAVKNLIAFAPPDAGQDPDQGVP